MQPYMMLSFLASVNLSYRFAGLLALECASTPPMIGLNGSLDFRTAPSNSKLLPWLDWEPVPEY